jgi:hypothetical protein
MGSRRDMGWAALDSCYNNCNRGLRMPKEKKKEKAKAAEPEMLTPEVEIVDPVDTASPVPPPHLEKVKKRLGLGLTLQLEDFGFVRIDASTEKDFIGTKEEIQEQTDQLMKDTGRDLNFALKKLASKFRVLKEQALDELYQREDK